MNSESRTLDRVRQIAADVFSVPFESVSATSSPDTIGSWESMQHLNFVLALEQEFEVQFEAKHIEEMRSIEIAVLTLEEVRDSGL